MAEVDTENVIEYIKEHSINDLLPWSAQNKAAVFFGLNCSDIEELALKNDILPARYQRNRNMLSISEQLQLFRSCITVIGCGGLGGYVIEEMARLGVGTIIAIDPDIFEEHNLNRQLLSTPATLGQAKVTAAATRVSEINPAVTLIPIQSAYTPENGKGLLMNSQVVVDALDSIQTRLALADTCSELDIPLVHGAIAGWYGHVATQFPGDTTIQGIYSNWVQGRGVEQHLGNPSFTPAVVASMQAAEVCKILLGRGGLLRNRKLSIDLLDMEVHETAYGIPIKPHS